MDQYASHYFAQSSVQGPRVELIADLRQLMGVVSGPLQCWLSSHYCSLTQNAMIAMHGYQKQEREKKKEINTSIWPTRILFFRDGVSEGEFHKVAETEVLHIKRAH